MTDRSREAIDAFSALTDIVGITRLIQYGRDVDTARFTLVFDTGNEVDLGSIDNLWSQSKFAKTLAVAASLFLKPVKPADWRVAITGLIVAGAQVEEMPDETAEAQVLEWLKRYTARATTDRKHAPALEEPFRDDGLIYVHAGHLAKYVRREYAEPIPIARIRHGLRRLGFDRRTVAYTRKNGAGNKESTASYWVAVEGVLDR